MKNLKSAFKPAPERFHYSVQSAINEAQSTEKKKRRFTHPVRAIIAVAIIIAIIPTSVFGATQLYNIVVNKSGNYGVEVKTETSVKSPKFVKLKVKPINGFEMMKHTDGLKYYRVGDTGVSCFSFYLVRPENGAGELYDNVESYRKIKINGHEAVVIKNAGLKDGRRFSIYFEKTNIILSCFVEPSVSEAEMKQMMKNVDVVEGTKKHHTDYGTVESNADNNNEDCPSVSIEMLSNYIPVSCGEVFNTSENKMTAKITNIRVIDNVLDLDHDDFYFWGNDPDEYINSNGTLKPRKSEILKEGDGINTVDKIIKTEKKKQKFVLADITYTNSSNKAQGAGMNLYIRNLEKKNGALDYLDNSDCNEDDGYAQYIENSNHGRNYYIYTVAPGESKTFTVGFRCDEDMLSHAYLIHDGELSETAYNYYSVKVQ